MIPIKQRLPINEFDYNEFPPPKIRNSIISRNKAQLIYESINTTKNLKTVYDYSTISNTEKHKNEKSLNNYFLNHIRSQSTEFKTIKSDGRANQFKPQNSGSIIKLNVPKIVTRRNPRESSFLNKKLKINFYGRLKKDRKISTIFKSKKFSCQKDKTNEIKVTLNDIVESGDPMKCFALISPERCHIKQSKNVTKARIRKQAKQENNDEKIEFYELGINDKKRRKQLINEYGYKTLESFFILRKNNKIEDMANLFENVVNWRLANTYKKMELMKIFNRTPLGIRKCVRLTELYDKYFINLQKMETISIRNINKRKHSIEPIKTYQKHIDKRETPTILSKAIDVENLVEALNKKHQVVCSRCISKDSLVSLKRNYNINPAKQIIFPRSSSNRLSPSEKSKNSGMHLYELNGAELESALLNREINEEKRLRQYTYVKSLIMSGKQDALSRKIEIERIKMDKERDKVRIQIAKS